MFGYMIYFMHEALYDITCCACLAFILHRTYYPLPDLGGIGLGWYGDSGYLDQNHVVRVALLGPENSFKVSMSTHHGCIPLNPDRLFD